MTSWQEFISIFLEVGGYLSYSPETPAKERFVEHSKALETLAKQDFGNNLYFGPAMRKSKGNSKEDVLGTKVLWVDYDDDKFPNMTIPPSMAVHSGHGWHLYWIINGDALTDLDEIERLNELLAFDIGMLNDVLDKVEVAKCRNANRILRVPSSMNIKQGQEPVEAVLRFCKPDMRYTLDDIKVLETLDPKMRRKIITGDLRGHRAKEMRDTRSERDWAVVTALVQAGASDDLIHILFNVHKVGDKHRDQNTSEKYLPRTIEKIRAKFAERGEDKKVTGGSVDHHVQELRIDERSNGYYLVGRGERRFTTFTLDPKALLYGIERDASDAIVADVHADGEITTDVSFPRGAFNSAQGLVKYLPKAQWQVLGTDADVKLLLPHLLDRLKEKGTPKVAASPVQGLHFVDGEPYFLGDRETLSATHYWQGYDAPLVWLPSQKEHPYMMLQPGLTPGELKFLAQTLPKVNIPETLWPMVGWFAASVIKLWLEQNGYRFPMLSVMATKGSGKTSILQRLLMPLFGQTGPGGENSDPIAWESATTNFVKLALLGSTNGTPIGFSEFRYDSVKNFLRFMLQAYDVGYEARGKSDQTTVAYPLCAPFHISGEDYIADSAVQERVIAAVLNPEVIAEGTEANEAFNLLQLNIPRGFAPAFIQRCLQMIKDGSMLELLKRCQTEFFAVYPQRLPVRIRRNYTVALLGTKLVTSILGIDEPSVTVFESSLRRVCNFETGRARTQADDFTENIANALSMGNGNFQWKYVERKNELTGATEHVVYVHMLSSHNWFKQSRARRGETSLEREAIKQQLSEAPYYGGCELINGVFMHGIVLEKAVAAGLDVPAEIPNLFQLG